LKGSAGQATGHLRLALIYYGRNTFFELIKYGAFLTLIYSQNAVLGLPKNRQKYVYCITTSCLD